MLFFLQNVIGAILGALGIFVGGPAGLHVGAALGLGIVFALIVPPATKSGLAVIPLGGVSAAFLSGYAAILAVLGEFRKEHLRLFLDLLDPWKMARYVHGELTRREIE